MAQKLFEVEGGYSDGNINYLSGSGAPGGDGSFQDDAPLGSVYEDYTNYLTYKKTADTNATSDWQVLVKSEKVFKEINQVGHGLSAGDWVYRDAGGTYVAAQSDDAATSDVIGVVESVADVDNFTLVSGGWSDLVSAEDEGSALFLDGTTAGAATTVKPSSGVQKNLGFVVDGKVFVAIDLSVEISTTEAPAVPLIITENITTIETVAQLLTQEDNGAMWLFEATGPAGRYQSVLSATHDGVGGDATDATFTEFGIMEAGTAIAGLAVGVGVNGTGASQTLDVTVVSTDEVDVSVRQIKL